MNKAVDPHAVFEGMTHNTFAGYLGISAQAVGNLVSKKIISTYDDGSLDPHLAYREFIKHYSDPEVRKKSKMQIDFDQMPDSFSKLTSGAVIGKSAKAVTQEEKAKNEILKNKKLEIEIAQMEGSLIDKDLAKAEIGNIANQFRQELTSAPSRMAPSMAAKLKVDEHDLRMELVSFMNRIQSEVKRRINRIEETLNG